MEIKTLNAIPFKITPKMKEVQTLKNAENYKLKIINTEERLKQP